jgi:hypothetical protein
MALPLSWVDFFKEASSCLYLHIPAFLLPSPRIVLFFQKGLITVNITITQSYIFVHLGDKQPRMSKGERGMSGSLIRLTVQKKG